ncbi:MAG TPA: YbhB/YbcL family Raf kinase inhibitor-like protein [Methanoregula sp.]|nr:YbhB/YbcL family Raf kinase inhibitor-like protein [Methanoregula sp.]
MNNRWLIITGVIIIAFLVFGGCTSTAPPPAASSAVSPAPSQPAYPPTLSSASSGMFTLNVDSLSPGSVLPDVYTCKGASESPEVSWDGVPPGTKSLALVLDDPDAPNGRFTHWIVYNIPPVSGELARGQPNAKVLANGAQHGDNSAGSRGYYPVCPPIGTTHRYIFRLYAVDMDITQPTADRDSIDWALADHTIAKTEFITTFKR